MACDLCGKKHVTLTDLRDIYKTAEVSQVCDECEKVVTKQLRKIRDFAFALIPKLLRQYLLQRSNGFKVESMTKTKTKEQNDYC